MSIATGCHSTGINIHRYHPFEDDTVIPFNTVTLAANSCLTQTARADAV